MACLSRALACASLLLALCAGWAAAYTKPGALGRALAAAGRPPAGSPGQRAKRSRGISHHRAAAAAASFRRSCAAAAAATPTLRRQLCAPSLLPPSALPFLTTACQSLPASRRPAGHHHRVSRRHAGAPAARRLGKGAGHLDLPHRPRQLHQRHLRPLRRAGARLGGASRDAKGCWGLGASCARCLRGPPRRRCVRRARGRPPSAPAPVRLQVWGNWDHVACRGPRVSYTEEKVRGGWGEGG